jgi:hypothetical protein
MTTPARMGLTVRLDDLIAGIKKGHPDALGQLSDAMLLADHLGDTADHLIGHFVDQARRSGASWADIGRSMGVTKQAVQKRFVTKGPGEPSRLDPSKGFSQFTEEARNVVMASMNEARAAGNPEIRPEHLLLGLLAEPDAAAMVAVAAEGVTPASIRTRVAEVLPAASESVPALIPYDAAARKVLEITFREAIRLGHDVVGPEHILLALLRIEKASGVLRSLGVKKAAVEASIRDRTRPED